MGGKKNTTDMNDKKDQIASEDFSQTGSAGGMSGTDTTEMTSSTDEQSLEEMEENTTDTDLGADSDTQSGSAGGQASAGEDFDPAAEDITYEEIGYVDDEE